MFIGDLSGRSRSDACPGALQVHAAADGGLARIRIPGGAVTAYQLRVVAAAARELGSGVIELTSRANLQVRGLQVRGLAGREVRAGDQGPSGAPDFAARMAAAGLLPSATHERVRNIVASPLAGRAPESRLDVRPLVAELDRELCARPMLADLPGRFLFALDDGSGDMPVLGADVTLLPDVPDVALLLAGADRGLRVPAGSAVAGLLAVAEAFLAERAEQGSGAWRLAELADGPARVAARAASAEPRLRLSASAVRPAGAAAARATGTVGTVAQRDGRCALIVLAPLGRLTVAQVEALARAAEVGGGNGGGNGGGEVRVTPWRAIVVPDLPPPAVGELRVSLTDAGLVGDPASPWLGLTACTGRPGCAKALADVHTDLHTHVGAGGSADLSGDAVRSPTGKGDLLPVHWAGCERRCGRPRGRVVDVIATEDGYRVELDGVSRTFADAEQTSAAVAATREGT
ncbi:precorrin-3B synthase [Microtetraspora sp. AC03309]|uniref:precorrin-3B synthase n=1 Tax=Microtetraspora sp. AC03309 TaxID=2779376 RepID=UPI001E4A0384|nr:precorrin-3B synthase [Microtetraspora sp. AC03309]MCC5581404.1 precorrin-3B synthase [Microtetraspora sp. AC03309]